MTGECFAILESLVVQMRADVQESKRRVALCASDTERAYYRGEEQSRNRCAAILQAAIARIRAEGEAE